MPPPLLRLCWAHDTVSGVHINAMYIYTTDLQIQIFKKNIELLIKERRKIYKIGRVDLRMVKKK
jgi:hypothetical protein